MFFLIRKVIALMFISLLVSMSLCSLSYANGQSTNTLSFLKAIRVAQNNDPWLSGNIEKQKSVHSMSQVSYSLPDPKISLGIGNLATDSLEFDQEPMSQIKVGITQMFPRGDSLNIKSAQLKKESEQYPLQRQDRKAKVAVTVGTLWLDAFEIEQTIELVKQNRKLFEQLIDLAESNYSSAKGNARQQDVVNAQIELTRLDDKLVQLEQQKQRLHGQRLQWLSDYSSSESGKANGSANVEKGMFEKLSLSAEMPELDLIEKQTVYGNYLSEQQLANYFVKHPAVLAIDKKLQASKTGIALAKQKYQPEWGVTASYAYRDDDPMGNDRSDLLSIGVTFDLPLFTENRQDHEVKSAVSQVEVIRTEKTLLLRKMMSSFASNRGRLITLEQRQSLYSNKLIPQVNDQIDTSLMAYTHDGGDFADVIRARMSLLNTQVDQLTMDVEEQKLALELNYLFMNTNTYHENNQNQFGASNDYK